MSQQQRVALALSNKPRLYDTCLRVYGVPKNLLPTFLNKITESDVRW